MRGGNSRNESSSRAPQPIGDARPFRQIRRRLDDDGFDTGFIAAMPFGVERARKRLGIMRNHTDTGEWLARRNLGMGNDMNMAALKPAKADLILQVRVIPPGQSDQFRFRSIMFPG